MTNNIYHPGGYVSNRYDRTKPRVTLDVAIEDQITLADIRHLVDKANNFADDAKIIVFKDVLRVVQESTKPVTSEELAAAIDPRDAFPRDHLGRFTKRD